MKRTFIVLLLAFAGINVFSATNEEKIAQLEMRIAALERNCPENRKLGDERRKLQEEAHKRGQADLKVYSKDELNEIEKLYQTWTPKKGEEQKAVTLTLLEKYPKANRTGCALLYLARNASGAEKITLLKQVIKDYNDCYYYDGVQVGPFARYCLGEALKQDGKDEEAQKYFEEIKNSYPNAIRHDWCRLVELIEK